MKNEVTATHGEKTIEIRLRFLADGIAEEKGKNVPKHGWTMGVLYLTENKSQGIKTQTKLILILLWKFQQR